jgi:hypothetical protein
VNRSKRLLFIMRRLKRHPLQLFESFALFFLVISMIFKFCIASHSQTY